MNTHTPETEHPIILIVGPTAGGKTEISLSLAEKLPRGGECLCVDSMQVYRGMDIGTAKPTIEEQQRVPHHLLDLVEPDEPFTVDHWLERSAGVIADVRSRGRHPILVGGTNLYIQNFLLGMMEGPAPDDQLRAELETCSGEQLRKRLLEVDPEAAERIHPNDRRRTIRALEVYQLTGSPISARQGQWAQPSSRADTILLGLNYPAE
ncbi:MAG: tRNA (adenosine(37)-N6)-dimethylallyltransferase MiaA, partial [Phycisphaerales bacterium]|nr:tRNA (adenosine(37)-N6)-dimethylallyltransferase MiaA [Phycisphaerales bacterium]